MNPMKARSTSLLHHCSVSSHWNIMQLLEQRMLREETKEEKEEKRNAYSGTLINGTAGTKSLIS